MGQRKLILGTIAGAVLGALAMQLDRETRNYTKECLNTLKDQSADVLSNPAESVQKVRHTFDKLNQNITVGTENAMNALEQVETTLGRLTNKNE